jgi:hypothetical protein
MMTSGSTTFFFDFDIFSERPTVSTRRAAGDRTTLPPVALDLLGQQPFARSPDRDRSRGRPCLA